MSGLFGFLSHDVPTIEIEPTFVVGEKFAGIADIGKACCQVQPGYTDFPPRCYRPKGHTGVHATGDMHVSAVWS